MVYLFDGCTLDTESFSLDRAGRTMQLRPKVFRLLMYLLTHRDRIVPKQELAEQLWPDQIVSDTAIESCIKLVRRVLGDSGQAQRVIQTRHGYGYRFIATAHRYRTRAVRRPMAV